jgi:hypothetical protein
MELLRPAMKVLEDNPGQKYCYQCWAKAAGLMSPEHLQQLAAYARTFVGHTDRIAENGVCTEPEWSELCAVFAHIERQ